MKTDAKSLLAQELAGTMRQFRRLGVPHGTHLGLRHSEFMLLAMLAHLLESNPKGVKVSDLSTKLQITPAAATHVINSLEESGLIERLADSGDRRIVLIRLTEKGQNIIEQRNAEFLEKLTGLVDFLGEEDSRELIRLLTSTFTYFKEKGNNNAGKF